MKSLYCRSSILRRDPRRPRVVFKTVGGGDLLAFAVIGDLAAKSWA